MTRPSHRDYLDHRPGALLVMSTSAKSPTKNQYLGSVREAVLNHVDNAVLVAASTNWTDDHTHWHRTTRRLVQRATRPVLVVPARNSMTREVLQNA